MPLHEAPSRTAPGFGQPRLQVVYLLVAIASTKHKTHVSGAAPFGKHALRRPQAGPVGYIQSGSERILEDYARLTLYFPVAEERQRLLGASAEAEEAWSNGRELRSLRRHKKTIARLARCCDIASEFASNPSAVAQVMTSSRVELRGRSCADFLIGAGRIDQIEHLLRGPGPGSTMSQPLRQ